MQTNNVARIIKTALSSETRRRQYLPPDGLKGDGYYEQREVEAYGGARGRWDARTARHQLAAARHTAAIIGELARLCADSCRMRRVEPECLHGRVDRTGHHAGVVEARIKQ